MRGKITNNQSTEPDQNNLLNGGGSKNQGSSLKRRQTNPFNCHQHFEKNSIIYFVIVGLIIIVVGSLFLDQDLPLSPNKNALIDGTNPHELTKERQHQYRTVDIKDRKQQTSIQDGKTKGQDNQTTITPQEETKTHIDINSKNSLKEIQVTAPEKTETKLPSEEVKQLVKDTKEKLKSQLLNMSPGSPAAPKKNLKSPTSKRPVAGVTVEQRNQAIQWLQLKNEDLQILTPLAQQELNYYENKYNISHYQEIPFCIVIPSYNNVKNNLHIKNIRSVIMQNYTNYHVIFIDDASTDGTGEEVQNYLRDNQTILPSSRYTVIKNKEQQRAMPNLRKAAKEFCKPNEIFLIADGDDELLGRQVLKLFNAIFHRDQAWFVYSNFLSIRHSVGYSRPFPTATKKNNKYRSYPFVTSHLRAFYTQLFLNIKEQDLKDIEGNYLKAANDVAICIPILEMSHDKVSYVPQLTYFYNSNTGQNNHKIRLKEQKGNDKMLRKRAKYDPLQTLFPKQSLTQSPLDPSPPQLSPPLISPKQEPSRRM